jgi:RNA polymerase sigma-70 factor, ECF subfamily
MRLVRVSHGRGLSQQRGEKTIARRYRRYFRIEHAWHRQAYTKAQFTSADGVAHPPVMKDCGAGRTEAMNIQKTFESSEPENHSHVGFAGASTNCDASLVAQAKSGSSLAFGELYGRHRLKIYRVAFRILRNQQDAEDAVQRSFQRAFTKLSRFREDSAFATWVTRIAINEALMLLRGRHSSQPLLENSVHAEPGQGRAEVADGGPTPEEILCQSERRTSLLHAIGQLRENLRVIVLHRELQGLTSKETAHRLGLTVSAVKARTFHARRSLRKHFERKFARSGSLVKLKKEEA